MNARFRMVHFVPDAFLGSRVPVAALVERNGEVSVVRVPHVPGPHCLGGRAVAATLQMVLEDLSSAVHFDRLPLSAGPQAVLGAPCEVPRSVREKDLHNWLESLLSRAQMPVTEEEETKHYRAPNRATFGYKFFENYKVDRYVRKTFRPEHDAKGVLSGAKTIGSVSHYVVGSGMLLLMEPIIPSRHTWESDAQEVAKTLGAYRMIIQDSDMRDRVKTVAYVLSGGSGDVRDQIKSDMDQFADEVVDIKNDRKREAFVTKVREIGISGMGELIS